MNGSDFVGQRGFYKPRNIATAIVLVVLLGAGWGTYDQFTRPAPIAADLTPGMPPVIGSATIVGYDQTNGDHVTNIELNDKPAGASAPYITIGIAHEGEHVDILVINDDETVLLRTPEGQVGWTQTVFLKDIVRVYK